MTNLEHISLVSLKKEHAKVSYKWRNDPKIWTYTGCKPDRKITLKIEESWISDVLKQDNRKVWAINVDGEYVGNIQLTDICYKKEAQLHIFIGNREYWGKGIGKKAIIELLEISKEKLHLKYVYLFVNKRNEPAIKLYNSVDFNEVSRDKEQIKMEKYLEK